MNVEKDLSCEICGRNLTPPDGFVRLYTMLNNLNLAAILTVLSILNIKGVVAKEGDWLHIFANPSYKGPQWRIAVMRVLAYVKKNDLAEPLASGMCRSCGGVNPLAGFSHYDNTFKDDKHEKLWKKFAELLGTEVRFGPPTFYPECNVGCYFPIGAMTRIPARTRRAAFHLAHNMMEDGRL